MRGPFLEVDSFWQLEAIVESELELPPRLNCFLLFFVKFALLLHDRGCPSNLMLGVFVSPVEGKHRSFLEQSEFFAVLLVDIQLLLNRFHFLEVLQGF